MSDEPIKNAEPIKVKVDLSLLKFKDWDALLDMQSGKMTKEILGLLDRCVVGGTADLPFTAFAEIMKQLGEEFRKMTNPPDAAGKA